MNIKILNFSKLFGDKIVFDNFSCEFESGKISAIMGASGVGKTTLLNAIAGLIDYNGTIEIDGVRHEKMCKENISYMFQEPRLIPQKTVFKNLDFALSSLLKDKVERREKIVKMLDKVGLKDSLKFYPHELSGGMAQRVALARAFLTPSKLLLMDEPFKGLDEDIKKTVMDIFKNLWEEERKTTLFVTHDKVEARELTDKIIDIPNQKIEATGEEKQWQNQ
ncbi:MAG: ABC transporter ATP-binding protein [Firmicutes bacterium]|nr:ABC transporter ATP-binding protein [Bacillota bacterium]MCL2256428.1 ABC transporter ATP-binding protein [Bacillota bacterium]